MIWTPDASLYHFESKSRDTELSGEEQDFLDLHLGHLVGPGKTDEKSLDHMY